jgi:hypothetical protein
MLDFVADVCDGLAWSFALWAIGLAIIAFVIDAVRSCIDESVKEAVAAIVGT